MVIFWKWRHSESGDRLEAEYDFKKVASDPKSIIVRFDPLKQRATSDGALDTLGLINSLNVLYTDILVNLSEKSQIQLFLHSSDGFRREHIEHENSLVREFKNRTTEDGRQRLSTFLFHHGESDLYVGYKSEQGLLGINGNWGELLRKDNSYVQAKPDNEDVKKAHFDFVWNLFHNNYKRKVYDAAQHFYRKLVPALETVFSEDDLNSLKKEFVETLKRSDKQDNEKLKKLVDTLEEKFAEYTSPDSGPLKELYKEVRKAVTNPIKALPGSHIYV